MLFIEKTDFILDQITLDYIRNNPSVLANYIETVQTRLDRTTKLLTKEINTDNPEALTQISIARQKINAMEAALQQLTE